MKVDLQCRKNNTEHHTHEITTERLIVRRGKPFRFTLSVERPHLDYIELTVQTGMKMLTWKLSEISKRSHLIGLFISGPDASEEKGTRSSFGTKQLQVNNSGKPWSLQVLDSTPSTATLSVLCPSNASIGLYSLFVKTGSSDAVTRVGTFTVLFNPWCEGTSLSLHISIISHCLWCVSRPHSPPPAHRWWGVPGQWRRETGVRYEWTGNRVQGSKWIRHYWSLGLWAGEMMECACVCTYFMTNPDF